MPLVFHVQLTVKVARIRAVDHSARLDLELKECRSKIICSSVGASTSHTCLFEFTSDVRDIIVV